MTPRADWLTVDEIADELRLHPKTVQRYIRSGALKARKIGRAYLVPRPDYDEWLRGDRGSSSTPEREQRKALQRERDRKLTDTTRKRQVAQAAHKRLCSVCGWLDGLVIGYPSLKLDAALAVARKGELEQFVESVTSGLATLEGLLKHLKDRQ